MGLLQKRRNSAPPAAFLAALSAESAVRTPGSRGGRTGRVTAALQRRTAMQPPSHSQHPQPASNNDLGLPPLTGVSPDQKRIFHGHPAQLHSGGPMQMEVRIPAAEMPVPLPPSRVVAARRRLRRRCRLHRRRLEASWPAHWKGALGGATAGHDCARARSVGRRHRFKRHRVSSELGAGSEQMTLQRFAPNFSATLERRVLR